MLRASPSWIDDLPAHRLIGEFSLWSADLLRLGDELARIRPYADVLHVDVADGHFAPAMLFFPDLVTAARKAIGLPIHVHLMTADEVLLSQIDQFVEAGSDVISIHLENAAMADAALDRLEAAGVAAGMVAKIETPLVDAARYLPRLRFFTLLGTAIGVKGRELDETAFERLREARRLIAASGSSKRIVLAADGGIREHTISELRAAGAESVVLGSLAFRSPDLPQRMAWLRAL
jgi:ribulose-phosphate 3-epimerase